MRPAPSGAVLTATKIQIPGVRSGLVGRARLVALLTGATDAKLALLQAPVGSGKTTLLAEWHAAADATRPFAWLSLDRGDNDPTRFVEGVIAALGTIVPGVGEQALLDLAGPARLTDVVLPSLVNDLAARSERLVLVVDDHHVVTDPRVHEAFTFALGHHPAALTLALATRASHRCRREASACGASLSRFARPTCGSATTKPRDCSSTRSASNSTQPISRASNTGPRAGPRACSRRHCCCRAARTARRSSPRPPEMIGRSSTTSASRCSTEGSLRPAPAAGRPQARRARWRRATRLRMPPRARAPPARSPAASLRQRSRRRSGRWQEAGDGAHAPGQRRGDQHARPGAGPEHEARHAGSLTRRRAPPAEPPTPPSPRASSGRSRP